jgi:hypothetical protein
MFERHPTYSNNMKINLLLTSIVGVAINLVRVLLEFAVAIFFTLNASSDTAWHLRHSNVSVIVVIENLLHPILVLIIALSIIDTKLDYTRSLREQRIPYSKAILASELPHIILKAVLMAVVNVRFLGLLGIAFGIGVLVFYLCDRVKPIDQISTLIFQKDEVIILPIRLVQLGLGIPICAVFISPILWIGAEWFIQSKLSIDQLIIFPSFSIFILLSLFRIMKSKQRIA